MFISRVALNEFTERVKHLTFEKNKVNPEITKQKLPRLHQRASYHLEYEKTDRDRGSLHQG